MKTLYHKLAAIKSFFLRGKFIAIYPSEKKRKLFLIRKVKMLWIKAQNVKKFECHWNWFLYSNKMLYEDNTKEKVLSDSRIMKKLTKMNVLFKIDQNLHVYYAILILRKKSEVLVSIVW